MAEHAEINQTNNRLLNFLVEEDRASLASHMQRVQLVPRQVLENPEAPIERIYFPEDGVLSVTGTSPTMGPMEIGIIGKEGMSGIMVVLGNDRSPLQTLVQNAGSAMVVDAPKLRDVMELRRSIRDLLLLYVQVFFIQTSQTALANAAALLSQRLARWLLMCADRLTSKNIPITHEFLAVTLGVQRPGVTIAINELEEHGMIKAQRGLISVLDRPSLIKMTDGTYGVAEATYERLFGDSRGAK